MSGDDRLRYESDDDVADVDRELVILGAVVAFGGWAVQRPTRRPTDAQPLQVLAERFARGEIDVEEYQRRRQILEGAR